MKSKIYITTWPNGYFGSASQSWKKVDVNIIRKKLKEALKCDVEISSIDDILKIDLQSTDYVVYCSAEDGALRAYIRDHIYMTAKKTTVVPSFDHLMAHENKGFQQIYRDKHKFGNLSGEYIITKMQLKEMTLPYVFKKVEGAGSSGVRLITKGDQSINRFFKLPLRRKIVLLARWIKLSKDEFSIYRYYRQRFRQGVTQRFIPELKNDYKILIFGDKFYGVERSVRKGDFRASGSGILRFDHAPEEVLDFADQVFQKLKAPYASLDIAVGKSGCNLIEYQVLNFGPKALLNSKGFYQKKDGKWMFNKIAPNLEDSFADGLVWYFEKNNLA